MTGKVKTEVLWVRHPRADEPEFREARSRERDLVRQALGTIVTEESTGSDAFLAVGWPLQAWEMFGSLLLNSARLVVDAQAQASWLEMIRDLCAASIYDMTDPEVTLLLEAVSQNTVCWNLADTQERSDEIRIMYLLLGAGIAQEFGVLDDALNLALRCLHDLAEGASDRNQPPR